MNTKTIEQPPTLAPETRPSQCPACGCTGRSETPEYTHFDCGLRLVFYRGEWIKNGAMTCSGAFAFAVSRGAELDAARAALETQHKATDDLWNERTRLHAELTRYQDADRQKTNEINILTQENRKVYAELETLRARADALQSHVDELATLRAERDALTERLEKAEWVIASTTKPNVISNLAERLRGVTGVNKPMDDIVNIWTLDMESSDERRAFKNKIRKQWFTLASALDDLCRAAALAPDAPAREPSQADATNDAPGVEGETK